MDLLANYSDADGSNTPKVDQNGEESEKSAQAMRAEYEKMMNSLTSGKANSDRTHHAGTSESGAKHPANKPGSDKSNSDSDSSSDDSSSEDEAKEKGGDTKQGASDSSEFSSDASSGSDSGGSDEETQKPSKPPPGPSSEKPRKTSISSNTKASVRRSRSRSASKGRRRRRSSDRHHVSHSRSRDHHHSRSHGHKSSSRSERRSGHSSQSRLSSSKDKRSRRRSSRERRHRDSHRRRRSGSRDAHRHRRRSPTHRRRHRSPNHKSSRSEKRQRSRSPLVTTKAEETSSASSHRPPVFVTAGVKFGRGRGRGGDAGRFKEALKQEFLQKIQQAQNAAMGKPGAVAGPSMMSSVATQSAGTGLQGCGGMNQVLMNQMQQFTSPQSLMPTLPGTLTPEQMQLNQRALLVATGRTREQVEAEFGIKVPTIYNENTNNLQEWAKREQKKSLLWKKDKKEKSSSVFGVSTFIPGHSQEENQKLSRLLGCRKRHGEEEAKEENPPVEVEQEVAENQQALSENLMMQYDQARLSTHFNRGVGLGYSTTMYQPH